ncbi:TetR/AcrR family transcriptional regulator [Streptomyces mutabilis]|uniref:TetR/AcrR family transcriptional regulator n=1 Tax=Streptomyces TaxID=1883 RepID=UPI000BD7A9D6|nr:MULTISPECIES: TetR/AcrR family transcriptional regulator [unclassified Streptomyces]MDG9691145.1 helix-turn-helix domain containing protein [Streptomyces sp. DH17]MDN3246116.1 helix-turn-helix domain-containing protein [Streptomyces sp. ZSW22]MDN3252445.1 helix-turn-helix domain-containing protein [Streptomyces sp. MA25(2023)]MDQ0385976.1 AcrR family transcriptional regulator [Streptomyces sp. DSM 42143]PAK22655.1 TetR family transcriptional regulator [Streptomyces sp. alain-838]
MPTAKPARERILDAAHELMLSVGLARTTTKEIAKGADCSEAALYKHFASKEELFIRVLSERLPRLAPLLQSLAAEPGRASLEENLTEIAHRAALFYEQSFPIAASLYAQTELKRRHDEAMRELGTGPHLPIAGLDAYLRAEQAAGRVRAEADTFAAASLLLGACAQRAFAYDATREGDMPPADAFARRLVRTVLVGIGGVGG